MKPQNLCWMILIILIIALSSGIAGIFLLKDDFVLVLNEAGQVLSQNNSVVEQDLDNAEWLVTDVIDGDTIEVVRADTVYRVRLLGIDTPEIKGSECFAYESKTRLNELIKNRLIRLEADLTQADKDRYERLLRYVYLEDRDINLELIREGYAREYTYKTEYSKQTLYTQTESQAYELKLGLWGMCDLEV